jgi:hypothetical protein
MSRFVSGVILGVVLGAGVVAWGADTYARQNAMNGWTVEIDGDEVCSNPTMWRATRTIECDEDER